MAHVDIQLLRRFGVFAKARTPMTEPSEPIANVAEGSKAKAAELAATLNEVLVVLRASGLVRED